jgi:ABC-type phosphate/phosphonate transport system substrate-binding protein
LILTVLLLVLVIVLPACRRRTEIAATALPTLTPTPRSTPLPAVATAVPVGSAENPVRMVVQPAGDRADAERSLDDFQAALNERTGFTFEVQLVERPAEALAALCSTPGAGPAVAWLSGVAYGVAALQECGQALAQVEREVDGRAETGRAIDVIVTADLTLESVADLAGRNICRLGPTDFTSWLGFGLVLNANQLSPVTDLGEVRDFDDVQALIQAVADGDCDAAGIESELLRELRSELGDALEQVRVLETTTPFPYAVLTASPALPLGIREALTEALPDMADDNALALDMRPLLGQTGVALTSDEDFDDLIRFLRSTGLDFRALGQ